MVLLTYPGVLGYDKPLNFHMTVRRKNNNEEGVLEFGKWPKVIIYAILISSLGSNPVGQQILKLGGITGPAVEQTQALQNDIQTLKADAKEIRLDIGSVKANNAILNSKVDDFKTTLTGFKIDFDKYKKPTE